MSAAVAPRTETDRALLAPRADYSGQGVQQWLSKPGCGIELKPIQCQALETIARQGGALLPLAVGSGKTFVALLAGSMLSADQAVILCPAGVVQQMQEQAAMLAQHFRMVPTRIVSYTGLSTNTDLLLALEKMRGRCVIVADEAHKLKNPRSARTMRVMRLFEAAPHLHFVALSGTMTSRSLTDFAHLAALALRDRSPVPRAGVHLESWAACLDAKGKPTPYDWARISPLARNAVAGLSGKARKEAVRGAYRQHFRACAGVVASAESELGQSLNIHRLDLDVPAEIRALLDQCEAGEDPQGDILEDDISVWRLQSQLSCGFYYRWVWPDGVIDDAWLQARRDWARCVRRELQERAAYLYDSPSLIEQHAETTKDRRTWPWLQRWQPHKAKPKPPTEAVWVSDYLLADIESRLRPGLIVWYQSQAMADALEARGLRVYRAGEQAPKDRAAWRRPNALSIAAHGTGTDGLQIVCHENLVVEPPSNGQAWEQLLGRTHRVKQPRDQVDFWVYSHTESLRGALRTALDDARYIEQTTGARQKLLAASIY